jgi:hypothetical protein
MEEKMKPILFSTPMVQAILDGRKTMTRRVIKPQPAIMANRKPLDGYSDSMIKAAGDFPTPKYQPGDVLWVRETWKPEDYQLIDGIWSCAIVYKVGGLNGRVHWPEGSDSIYDLCLVWHSPVAMPREAARLYLRVTDVRVERLNQITNNDILREGLRSESCKICVHDGGSGCDHCFAILNPFRKSWDARNTKRGYGWDSNPWVWVISFERMEEADNG